MPAEGLSLTIRFLDIWCCEACPEETSIKPPTRQCLYFPCRSETGQWSSTFEYCRGKCRTTSNSTVNENAYLATNKHCFSPLGAQQEINLNCKSNRCRASIA